MLDNALSAEELQAVRHDLKAMETELSCAGCVSRPAASGWCIRAAIESPMLSGGPVPSVSDVWDLATSPNSLFSCSFDRHMRSDSLLWVREEDVAADSGTPRATHIALGPPSLQFHPAKKMKMLSARATTATTASISRRTRPPRVLAQRL